MSSPYSLAKWEFKRKKAFPTGRRHGGNLVSVSLSPETWLPWRMSGVDRREGAEENLKTDRYGSNSWADCPVPLASELAISRETGATLLDQYGAVVSSDRPNVKRADIVLSAAA